MTRIVAGRARTACQLTTEHDRSIAARRIAGFALGTNLITHPKRVQESLGPYRDRLTPREPHPASKAGRTSSITTQPESHSHS